MTHSIFKITIGLCLFTLNACGALKTQLPDLVIKDAHYNASTSIAFSADSKYMATGGHLGDVIIWTVPAGKKITELKAHDKAISGLVWLDGHTIISTAKDGKIVVWDLQNKKIIHQVASTKIMSMSYMPKTKRLYTGHKDGYIRAWTYPSLKILAQYDMQAPISSVATSHHEKWVAASNTKSRVALLSADLKLERELERKRKNALELRFSFDDKQLASGAGSNLFLWDLPTGKLTVVKTEHQGYLNSLDYSPNGIHLVTLCRVSVAYIQLRNLKTGKVDRRLLAHKLCGYTIRISPNGKYVGSTSDDESVRLYDISKPYNPVKPALDYLERN